MDNMQEKEHKGIRKKESVCLCARVLTSSSLRLIIWMPSFSARVVSSLFFSSIRTMVLMLCSWPDTHSSNSRTFSTTSQITVDISAREKERKRLWGRQTETPKLIPWRMSVQKKPELQVFTIKCGVFFGYLFWLCRPGWKLSLLQVCYMLLTQTKPAKMVTPFWTWLAGCVWFLTFVYDVADSLGAQCVIQWNSHQWVCVASQLRYSPL